MGKQVAGEEWRDLEQGEEFYRADRWKAEIDAARANIDPLRRRDVVVRVCGRTGAPLARRQVEIVQQDSAFLWGFCGWGYYNQLLDGTFDHPKNVCARRWATELFNAVSIMLYWAEGHTGGAPTTEELQGCQRYDHVERIAEWAGGNGLTAKGHPLFWPVPKALPLWLARYDNATRMKFLETRIRGLTARLRGKVRVYDAVNEMMWEPAFKNTAQRHWPHLEEIEAIADDAEAVLRWAREEDPDACYLLNEYGVDWGDHEKITVPAHDGSLISRHEQLQRYIALLKRLVDRGAPPDAIGLQTPHGSWGHHDRQVRAYDALGEATGLPVHITEFRPSTDHLRKIGMPEDEIQARLCEYLENFLTCAFGNRHVEAFFFWGDPHLYDGRGPTKVYHHLRGLLRERWRTRAAAETDDEGVVRFRGFSGPYSLRFPRSATQASGIRFTVSPGSRPLEIELPAAIPPGPDQAGGS